MAPVYQLFGKRLFDLLIAVPILILISPLMLLLGLCSLLVHSRPILFKQLRIGWRENPFILCKFRSMAETRDQSGALLSDADRLTSFGRFLRSTSLDELPTLWHVLRGDMSLVGPRPLLPEYLPRYTAFQRRRHEVTPGVTGLAQVKGRNSISWEKKFEFDVYYVDHCSLRLDLRILMMTLVSVIRRDGITQAGHATGPPFLGSKRETSK
ncbi:MAG TPA: sugar transferase [Bryobacteraceae bacterium]|jgi:lipopolysaccharide/colanic/teichoic acid biosynthesis glycosyltransferase|nr:sugar transferase [Bryobacteraceae bacterium]